MRYFTPNQSIYFNIEKILQFITGVHFTRESKRDLLSFLENLCHCLTSFNVVDLVVVFYWPECNGGDLSGD